MPFALAFLFSLVPFGAQVRAATTLLVDDDGVQCPSATYMTISAAVAAASPGDTIQVCAGIYPELVVVNKTLSFLGPQPNDARTRSVPLTSEAVVGAPDGAFQIEANNVVVNGFTIQGVISDPSAPPFTGLGAGIWTNPGFSGTEGGHQIFNNIIQSNVAGIELDSTCAANPTLVKFNLIQNNNVPGAGSGNGIETNFGLCNATIDNNKFSGHTNSSVLVVAASSGLAVTNNVLVGGTPEGIAFLFVSSSTISGNVSTGSTSNGTIDLFGGNSGVTVTSNTLLSGLRAIVVDNPFSAFGVPPNSNIAAHLNCIKGNAIAGLQVDAGAYPMTPHLDAKSNWWGSASGPFEATGNPSGTGDKIVDPDMNVDFNPWLMKPPSGPCPPPPNTPGKVTGGGQITGDPAFSPLGDLISLPALIPSVSDPTAQATFGFRVSCCSTAGSATGNLEYNDHQAGVRIKAQSINTLVISSPGTACPTTAGSKHAEFGGTASVIRSIGTTTEPFTVDVDDCGEPGTMDTFGIQTTTYSNEPPKTLIGGNIQIH